MSQFVTKKIGAKNRTLGSILKAARHKAGISLEQAEEDIKVRLKFLKALEEGRYQELPSEAYNIGFLRCYCDYLHLKSERLVNLYKQERAQTKLAPSSNYQLAPQRVSDWHFLITPKVIGFAVAIILFGSIISYIGIQLKKFTRPPDLTITNIPTEFSTSRDAIEIKGRTTEGSIVMMNSDPVAVSAEGDFAQNIQLAPGINEIVIMARSRAGKESRKVVKVLYSQDLAKLNIRVNKEIDAP